MSDAAPDRPASPEGPPMAASRPAPDGARSGPAAPSTGPVADLDVGGGESARPSTSAPSRRRRRGSRGGTNRSRSSVAIDGATPAMDDEPPSPIAPLPLPLAPVEKPKIGDSRPGSAAAPPAGRSPSPGRNGRAVAKAGGAASDSSPSSSDSSGSSVVGTGSAAGRAGSGGRPSGSGRSRTRSGGPGPDATGTGAAATGSDRSSAAASASGPPAGSSSGSSRASRSAGGSGGSAAGSTSSPSEEGATATRRRRRGGRSGRGPDGEGLVAVTSDEADLDTLERRRGRERKGRPVGRYLMLVHVQPNATQIAVLEGRSLIEHYVSRPADDATQIDGNIYLGRVQNVLPGMEAAFVDIGTPKNAVLYRGDIRYDRDEIEGEPKPSRGRGGGGSRDARIEQLLKVGQVIVCQVTKNPIGTKGARLSQEVSLPGRFVVLIPGSDTYGISKRLADDERKRLRRILDDIRPAGHGLIVRTAAEGATADELRRDVARLLRQWGDIDGRAKRSKAPALLYREPDMALRVIREEFNNDYRGVILDDHALYEEVRDYVASISPDLADRVEYAGDSDSPLPIFERHHVHEQVHKALDRKVWLPSGGSLIIERTEALTVIDVNTGKNVGTSNLEETVFRNNLEAAEEIARQLRLRDIGGIIVIDFIDMEIHANRAEVARAFRDALARDKTRTQVFDISELGLIEMTRKRVSEGLVESFSQTCPTCGGRGLLLDEELLSAEL